MTQPLSAHSLTPPEAAVVPGSPVFWQCPFGCGQSYRRSSGRSIRRHVSACFRSQNAAVAALSDSELSILIGAQQDSGKLHTGIRRWRLRQPRRLAAQLSDQDRWDCVWECGKSCRSTSSRSIQRHANECHMRTDGQDGEVDYRQLRGGVRLTERIDTASDGSDTRSDSDSIASLYIPQRTLSYPGSAFTSSHSFVYSPQPLTAHDAMRTAGSHLLAVEAREHADDLCAPSLLEAALSAPPMWPPVLPLASTSAPSAFSREICSSYSAALPQQQMSVPVRPLVPSPPPHAHPGLLFTFPDAPSFDTDYEARSTRPLHLSHASLLAPLASSSTSDLHMPYAAEQQLPSQPSWSGRAASPPLQSSHGQPAASPYHPPVHDTHPPLPVLPSAVSDDFAHDQRRSLISALYTRYGAAHPLFHDPSRLLDALNAHSASVVPLLPLSSLDTSPLPTPASALSSHVPSSLLANYRRSAE